MYLYVLTIKAPAKQLAKSTALASITSLGKCSLDILQWSAKEDLFKFYAFRMKTQFPLIGG